MNAHELLTLLYTRGARISIQNTQVRIIAPPGSLSDEVWSELELRKSELCELLKSRDAGYERVTLERSVRPDRICLSYAQRRLWFVDRLEGSSTEYNMSAALRLRGDLDRAALTKAINAIVERHESLRTRSEETDGEPIQVIEPEL